jgi:hypothetical protein
MKKWIEQVMASEKRIALPIMTHPGIEYIGKTVREAVTDGEVHFAAIKALAERFPSAASTVIMDLTVEAEAFSAVPGNGLCGYLDGKRVLAGNRRFVEREVRLPAALT